MTLLHSITMAKRWSPWESGGPRYLEFTGQSTGKEKAMQREIFRGLQQALWRKQMKILTCCVTSFTLSSKKCKWVTESGLVLLGHGEQKGERARGRRQLLLVMDTLINLISVMHSWVDTRVKMYPMLHFKYVQFIAFQLDLNKVLWRNSKSIIFSPFQIYFPHETLQTTRK
jgi:hypothetical protein